MSNVVSITNGKAVVVPVATSTTDAMHVGLNSLLKELVGRTRVSFDPKDFDIGFKFENGVLLLEVHGSTKYGKFVLEEIDQQILHEGMSVSTDPAARELRAAVNEESIADGSVRQHTWKPLIGNGGYTLGYQCQDCGQIASAAGSNADTSCVGHRHSWTLTARNMYQCLVCEERRSVVSNGLVIYPTYGTLEHIWDYQGWSAADTFKCRYCNETTNSINPLSVCSGSAIT